MRETAILRALSELDRWTRRREELRGRKDARAEIEMVDRQVAYYQALTEDMKKQTRPAGTRDFFALLR